MPYASIIIPTHDRWSTLAEAVGSAQKQTVRDIEILIVGDGCTPDVRSVASGIAADDPRVVFLDLPKAPLRGAANRDLAVRKASSDRIFYNDDDDILLPHHVDTLGAQLDEVDLVDTPCASFGLDGRFSLGLLNSESALQRRLLSEGSYKAVFDTHFAHRKSAYVDHAPGWLAASDRRVVMHMMQSFARTAELRWKTLQRTTAISLHGARRTAMTPAARAAEIAALSRRASAGLETEIREAGGYCGHAQTVLQALQGNVVETPEALFGLLDLDASHFLSERQRLALQAMLAVAAGRLPDEASTSLAIDELIEPLLAPYLTPLARLTPLLKMLDREKVREIVQGLQDRPSKHLAVAELSMHRGDVSAIDEGAHARFDESPPEARLFFAHGIAASLHAHGHYERAWTWLSSASALAPASFRMVKFWRLFETVAKATGRPHEAAAAGQTAAALDGLND